jgi:hypothetical protein
MALFQAIFITVEFRLQEPHCMHELIISCALSLVNHKIRQYALVNRQRSFFHPPLVLLLQQSHLHDVYYRRQGSFLCG